MSTDSARPLTCKSCVHHRPTDCAKLCIGHPGRTLRQCTASDYLPGSDEREDWQEIADWQNAFTKQEARQNAR